MDTAPSSSSLINVKNTLGTTIADGSGSDQSGNYGSLRTVSGSSYANVTMAKTFDIAGQDSVYTFNIKTQAETTTSTTGVVTTSIRFKAGSYFYVEFARDISPRFNQMGIIRCYHEGNPTYCKYESERRIAFLARSDLNHNQTYGHNFSIIGVQRPADFQNYKKMYFALVPYLKEFNELTYQDSDSIEDASTTDQAATVLPVVYFSQDSGTAIRSTYTMTMHIKMPANTVNENVPIYVDFPGDFDEAMFLGWSPSCQFRNVQIDKNDTITNFASSCSLDNIRRVKINMSSDANNTDTRLYELTISSIPTYPREQSHTNAPLVWFGNSTTTTVPLYKTNLGYFNGTFNLKVFTFSDSTKQLLTWDSNVAECYIGTYRCKAKLRVQNSENFFYDIESITSTGTYADLFKFNPKKLGVETGKPYKEFEIAPKASTSPGYYQLKWNHEQTIYYSVLPPLFIIAHNSQTELNVASLSASYDVPDGGSSLPIIFDFAGKMPETEVTIDGTAKSLEINGTNYITSKYVTFKASQKTMKFIESYTSSQIQFVVEGKKVTGTGEPDTPSATLSWTLSGTNSGSYKKPNDVTVNVVNAIKRTPVLTLNNPESSSQGYQTITAKCSHSSIFYYVVSQDETATQIEYSSIKIAIKDANIQETEIGTVYTNPKRTFYGYYHATAAYTEYGITITGKLQSEAIHYLRMYCVNAMGTPSEKKDIHWKQASNGGKPLILTMKFESTNNTAYVQLSSSQKKEVACIICKEAKVEKDKVFGTDGVACSEAGTVVTNTTNSTRRVLQTTANATEYYVVMPDLFVASGSLDNVKTKLESFEFRNALAASTTLEGVKLNSITCSINSDYPALPLIDSPSVISTENDITFSWTGVNNTYGFVFVGVTQYTNSTVDPTALQLKKNSGYQFDAFNKAFYYQDTAISVTVSPTTKCLDYKYYWIVTNEDPDTYQYTTGVKSRAIKTIGCPNDNAIIAKCSYASTFYYVVSQDQAATQIEYSSIKTASEDDDIQETEIGTVYTNPKRTFYGYYPAISAGIEYSITITGKLQSEATYYLRMYCVNEMGTPSEKKDIHWKQASNGGKPLILTMKFESTNNTAYVQLSSSQKKEVACIICKEANVEKDKVFDIDGVACSDTETAVTNTNNRINATEYYVVMPDLFAAYGSLDNVKTKLESTEFKNALAASTILEGVKLNSVTCLINSDYPALPLIDSPSVISTENDITFSWTGVNNTYGFIFVGVAQYTNSTVDPTALQLKKNSGYQFDAFNKAFYYQDTAISVTVSPTTKCLDYKYYWIVTNEDPDTYQYTTGVKSGTIKTIGCPTFAEIINSTLFKIAVFFGLMILTKENK